MKICKYLHIVTTPSIPSPHHPHHSCHPRHPRYPRHPSHQPCHQLVLPPQYRLLFTVGSSRLQTFSLFIKNPADARPNSCPATQICDQKHQSLECLSFSSLRPLNFETHQRVIPKRWSFSGHSSINPNIAKGTAD